MNTLDRLIQILCEERGMPVPKIAQEEKQNFFRALCNVREPKAANTEFLSLQDEYLKALATSRGIVSTETLYFKDRIALWQGDITRLAADGIVNACNCKLLGCFQPLHNCIDNAIHSFAGIQVRLDCADMMQGKEEPNGQVKITRGYNLPSRYIFHTVGPIVYGTVSRQNRIDLTNCYLSCLNKAGEMELKTLAFCCLSTGVYRFPQEEACKIAVSTVKNWFNEHKNNDLKVIFNVFTQRDKEVYSHELSI